MCNCCTDRDVSLVFLVFAQALRNCFISIGDLSSFVFFLIFFGYDREPIETEAHGPVCQILEEQPEYRLAIDVVLLRLSQSKIFNMAGTTATTTATAKIRLG